MFCRLLRDNGKECGIMMRLVTRSDFDGLVCAMILKELGLIEEIKFVHPKDVQDGKVELCENDTCDISNFTELLSLCQCVLTRCTVKYYKCLTIAVGIFPVNYPVDLF